MTQARTKFRITPAEMTHDFWRKFFGHELVGSARDLLRVLHRLVDHAGHLHVATERDPGEAVVGVSDLLSDHARGEADAEPLHPDSHRTCRDVVAELVYDDHDTDHEDEREGDGEK
ncbi:MAG: hypothetical protein R3E97_21620 [Candidatus Eisenbacteria bacterium]